MFKILKILIICFTLLALMISLLFFSLLWKYTPELPSYSKILQYKPELSSRLYSSDGVLLKSYHREERIFIPIERIPKQLINAFLSSEDKNFYSHFGIFRQTLSAGRNPFSILVIRSHDANPSHQTAERISALEPVVPAHPAPCFRYDSCPDITCFPFS